MCLGSGRSFASSELTHLRVPVDYGCGWGGWGSALRLQGKDSADAPRDPRLGGCDTGLPLYPTPLPRFHSVAPRSVSFCFSSVAPAHLPLGTLLPAPGPHTMPGGFLPPPLPQPHPGNQQGSPPRSAECPLTARSPEPTRHTQKLLPHPVPTSMVGQSTRSPHPDPPTLVGHVHHLSVPKRTPLLLLSFK